MTGRIKTKASQRGREALLGQGTPTTWMGASTRAHTHTHLSEEGTGKETTDFAPFSIEENAFVIEGCVFPADERALRPRAPHCPGERSSLISEPRSDFWRYC